MVVFFVTDRPDENVRIKSSSAATTKPKQASFTKDSYNQHTFSCCCLTISAKAIQTRDLL